MRPAQTILLIACFSLSCGDKGGGGEGDGSGSGDGAGGGPPNFSALEDQCMSHCWDFYTRACACTVEVYDGSIYESVDQCLEASEDAGVACNSCEAETLEYEYDYYTDAYGPACGLAMAESEADEYRCAASVTQDQSCEDVLQSSFPSECYIGEDDLAACTGG